MGKAAIQDVLDEGFRPEQFGFASGNTGNWNASGGYIDKVLQQASRWAENYIGAPTYAAAAANTYVGDALARAEICYAKSVLFTRRVAFIDSGGTVSMGAVDVQYLNRREMIAHANAAWECAQSNLAEAIRATGGDPDAIYGGSSFGHIETGALPIAVTGAING